MSKINIVSVEKVDKKFFEKMLYSKFCLSKKEVNFDDCPNCGLNKIGGKNGDTRINT